MTEPDGHFLRRCEGLHVAARRVFGGQFLGGRQRLSTAAAGTEVTGYTDYVSGDDFRYVDWHRAARLDELVSKQFRGSEVGRVAILVDQSGSMAIGRPSKSELAQRLAGALGYLALAEGMTVRLFGGVDNVSDAPPVHGPRSAPAWFRTVGVLGQPQRTWDIEAATRSVLQQGWADGAVVVISDLLGPTGFQTSLERLRRAGCELHVVQVLAAEDIDPYYAGRVGLHDVESNGWLSTDLDEEDLAHYREAMRDYLRTVRAYCGRYEIGLSQFRSDMPLEQCVERMIRSAANRSRQAAG